MINSYKDLIVWQKSIILVTDIYKVTRDFPPQETYGLTSQIRRAAVSIPSNIAEGNSRNTKKDYSQFLRIAYGSAAELETQFLISKKLGFIDDNGYNIIAANLEEIKKMLISIIKKFQTNP